MRAIPVSGFTPASDIIRTGTLAVLEALIPTLGERGVATDSQFELQCFTAGTWSYISRGSRVSKPPTTGWSALNGGSVSAVGGMRSMSMPANAGVQWRGEVRSPPAAPFIRIARFWNTGHVGEVCVGLHQSSDDRLIVETMATTGGSNLQKYNNFTSFNTNYNTGGYAPSPLGVWWGMEDDNVDTRHYWSVDRVNWNPFRLTRTRTDFLTADGLWWGGYTNSTLYPCALLLDDWYEETGTSTLPVVLP